MLFANYNYKEVNQKKSFPYSITRNRIHAMDMQYTFFYRGIYTMRLRVHYYHANICNGHSTFRYLLV